jgi:hypothetical protein
LRLVDDPDGVIQGISGVILRGLGFSFCHFDVMLVAFAVDAVVQVLHFRCSICFQRLPFALRAVSGLPGLLFDVTLTGCDIFLGLADARFDLFVSFVPGGVEGVLQVGCSLLQSVYLVGNVHLLLLDLD